MTFETHTGDFFGFESLLSETERGIVLRVREFLRTQVAPIVNDHWARAEFPFGIIDGFRDLDIAGLMYDGLAAHRGTRLLTGFLALEIGRCDPSVNSFYGVHTGLAMGASTGAAPKSSGSAGCRRWRGWRRIGAFGLTEPHGGSDVAGGHGDHRAPRR